MRRYRFFTYERLGNQTFTDFFAKLQELSTAANLEEMEMNDYLIFRVIAGINDSKSVDKLLSIPQQEFTLEEINRIAVQCEAANNYSLGSKAVANKVSHKKPQQPEAQSPVKTGSMTKTRNDFLHLSGAAKITALKEHGLCIRCGQKMHQDGIPCPHLATQCHRCGTRGHISPVCAKSTSPDQ